MFGNSIQMAIHKLSSYPSVWAERDGDVAAMQPVTFAGCCLVVRQYADGISIYRMIYCRQSSTD